MKPVNQRAFCPYCGSGEITESIRNGDFIGGKLVYWYCDHCGHRLYPEDFITEQEAERRF